jgi:hypothetical protein
MGVISIDQLIADFVRYLDSNQWDNLKNREGFDAIFVDELHLFNKLERMVFPELIRDKGPLAPSKPIFMAYDFRQAERDYVGFGEQSDLRRAGSWVGANFEASDVVELSQVFRYTPEIAEFIHHLSEPFATLDIFDDINLVPSEAAQRNKDATPRLKEFTTNTSLYAWTFVEARKKAKELQSGRKVAVICMDDSLFATYTSAGQHKGEFVPMNSRDSLGDIRFAGKRFVFSTPEYVAGLQFEAVYLINLDERVRIASDESPLLRRQYLARVYLAASRASKMITICTSREGGGPSNVLTRCISLGSLVKS